MMTKRILFFFFCLATQPAFSQIDHPAHRFIGTDSVETYASGRYVSHSFLHNWLMGRNYRRQWQQVVTLPVFRLSATSLKIRELGGGMQTKSLKLEDAAGKEWSLRTIDKDVSGALPSSLHNTLASKVAQDQISASMPYGAPVVGALARSVGIIAAQPVIYFVADDTALGPYRSIFANSVCMLEERDPRFNSTVSTEKVVHQLQRDNQYRINEKLLLKARLLDMLVSDWDRHFDNWRWGLKDSGRLHYYYAVPRDRDWAFYYSGGLVPKLARLTALRHFINFKETPSYLQSLNAKSHLFDEMFLSDLDITDWQQAITEFQQSLTDAAIEKAVKKMPAAIVADIGDDFIRKLKSRRDNLKEAVLDYYRYISRDVQIDGSNEDEVFSVTPAENGFRLTIYRVAKKSGAERQVIFNRAFRRDETFRITINALGGNDRFEIAEDVATSIRLRLNGGTGTDTYDLNGKVRTTVNDTAAENNILRNKNKSRVRFN